MSGNRMVIRRDWMQERPAWVKEMACSKRYRRWATGLLMAITLLGFFVIGGLYAEPPASSVEEGKSLFQQLCASCHTIARGDLIGPDLKGITAQRERGWLVRWIKQPDKMLAEGDPLATDLLRRYKNVPMPNLGLTEAQVNSILAYLETTGTGAAASTELPTLYIPTLAGSFVLLLALTGLGLLMGRKRVEVRS